jgi:hypothetical protein
VSNKMKNASSEPEVDGWTVSRIVQTVLVFLVLLIFAVFSGKEFLASRIIPPLYPGDGVTFQTKLSAFLPNLKRTVVDSDVYILDSGKPGGTVLVLGGTHPDEPSGHLTAVVLLEKAKVTTGRLIVIPEADRSAFTHNKPLEAYPNGFTIKTSNGDRRFRFGSRCANPIDQWPDPDIYVHRPSGQRLSGDECRNLNRSYPGRPDGVLIERVAFAIKTLIQHEKVDVTIDLHEAPLEYFFINSMAMHERSRTIGIMASLNLSEQGIQMGVESSPPNLHGFTHRELGDYTQTLTFLMETANPSQGRLRGRTDENLVLTGKDSCYVAADKLHRLFISFDKKGQPLSLRVARHLAGIREIVNCYNDQAHEERRVIITQIPAYKDVITKGVGNYLNGPK